MSPSLMGSSSMAPVKDIVLALKRNGRNNGWRRHVPPHNHMSSLSAFNPSRCFGLLPRRFCSAPAWSGTMTSHSCNGALVDDAIVRGWNFETEFNGIRNEVVNGRRERRASIYVVASRQEEGVWGCGSRSLGEL